MGMCKKCYKRKRCLEADEHGRCKEYRRKNEIAEEIERIAQGEEPNEWYRIFGKSTINAVRPDGTLEHYEHTYEETIQEKEKDVLEPQGKEDKMREVPILPKK